MPAIHIEPVYVRMGERISELRRERAMTQERLASAAGVSANYLARVEGGLHRATLPKLEAIAGALGVSVGAVLDRGAPPMKAPAMFMLPGLLEVLERISREDQRVLLRVAERLPRKTKRRTGSRRSRP